MRPIIHSQKHYVQMSRSTTNTVSLNNENLVVAVESTVANLVDEVSEGAVVKAVFIELWVLDSGNDGSFLVTVGKYPSGLASMTFAQGAALGTFNNKKNLLYVTQGLTPNDGIAQPIVLLRQWIKIPKSKQRFGLGDKLKLTVSNNGLNDLFYCGFATYKEYS